MPALEIGGKRIEYLVLRGTSRRYTYFRFRSDLTLEVVLPRGRLGDASRAITERREWILQKYEEMQRTKRILDDQRVMFDGKFLEISFEQGLEKEEILPDLERGIVVVRASDRSRVKELVRRWFLKETSRYVMKRLADLAPPCRPPTRWPTSGRLRTGATAPGQGGSPSAGSSSPSRRGSATT